MLLLVVSIISMLVSWLTAFMSKKDLQLGVSGGILIISFLVSMLFVSGLKSSKQQNKEIIHNYHIISAQIEEYNDDNTSTILIQELYEDCERIDKIIEDHKEHHGSEWIGSLYTKDIAELKPLTPKFIDKFHRHGKH